MQTVPFRAQQKVTMEETRHTMTFSKPIAELEKLGMIEINEGHCVLTRKGLLFADSIASMLISHDVSKWA